MTKLGSRFPGPGDFAGSHDRRTSDALNGAQSTYSGSVAVTTLDRELVKKVLPAKLKLADPLAPLSEHPVILVVGRQRNPHALNNGYLRPVGDPYQEMILLVPFVVRGGDDHWHSFAVRMYLNDVEPILVGNSAYAYSKEFAHFAEAGNSARRTTDIRSVLGDNLYACDVELKGEWRGANDDPPPRWTDLKTIFEMPIVGCDFLDYDLERFVCSYWEWEYSMAELAPAASSHRFLRPFRGGMEDWVQLGTLPNAPDGSFAIRGLRWRLALPPPDCLFPQ